MEKYMLAGTGGPDGIQVLTYGAQGLRLAARGGPPCVSFLAQGPDGFVLGGVEADTFRQTAGGAVVSLRLEGGRLRPCGAAAGLGRGICHVAVAPRRRLVFAASYPAGSVDILSLGKSGELTPLGRLCRTGAGPHPAQTGPHAHCCAVTPGEDTLYVCDLGTDEIACYALAASGRQWSFRLPPGSGPRHLVLGKDARFLYIACELSNEVLVMRAADGAVVQRVDCRPRAQGFCALSSIRWLPGRTGLAVGCRGQDGVWLLPVLRSGRLGAPAFFAARACYPWDVLPLGEGRFAAAFADSGFVQLGRCGAAGWEPESELAVCRPTCLLTQ